MPLTLPLATVVRKLQLKHPHLMMRNFRVLKDSNDHWLWLPIVLEHNHFQSRRETSQSMLSTGTRLT
jgi:hypothetical protein